MTTCTCGKPLHEAGRDLDVCVAKLKGWTDIKNIVMPAIGLVGLPPDGDEKEPVPHYSKDMNDAMTLWEDFKPDIYMHKFSDKYVIRKNTNKIASADELLKLMESKKRRGLFLDIVAYAKTPALAICRAYLSCGGE